MSTPKIQKEDEMGKLVVDGAAFILAFGALIEMLPALASLLSIVWTVMRIIDWFKGKRRERSD